jgi:hypothetical protein
MDYKCLICKKDYSSYQSLWIHNKKFHNHSIQQKTSDDYRLTSGDCHGKSPSSLSDLTCKYCNKTFTRKNNLNYHIKNKCKEKERKIMEEKIYIKEIEKLKLEIDKLKHKDSKKSTKNVINNYINSNVNSNNNNNMNSNNNLSICNPGDENINSLTTSEKKMIMTEGMNSIISLVENLNFNERLPENHNFFTSAINDKYVNTYDKKNNTINKQSKIDLFDKILFTHMNKLETLSKSSQKFSDVFDKLKSFIYLKKGRRQFFIQLNMLSYNKRNMVIQTINKLMVDETITPEEVPIKFEEEVKQIAQKPEEECKVENIMDSDEENEEDDEDESSSEDENLPILFQRKQLLQPLQDTTKQSKAPTLNNRKPIIKPKEFIV